MGAKHLRIVMVCGALSACNGCFGIKSPVDQPGSTLAKSCDEQAPLLAPQKLDVLFVIDNSDSMREEQEGVAANLTTFVSALHESGGVTQDIRVAVINTTVYEHVHDDPSRFDAFYDCQFMPNVVKPTFCDSAGKLQPASTGERWLESNDPTFIDKFAGLVKQGTTGSGQETPFEALRLALSANADFMRDGARLLIVVLSDEDDCSETARPSVVTVGPQHGVDYCGGANATKLTPVSTYFDFLTTLKDSTGAIKEVIFTSIAPVSDDTTKAAMPIVEGGELRNIGCPTSNGAGIRHRQMAEMFDKDLSNLASICAVDYQKTLRDIALNLDVSQTVDVQGVADPRLLQAIITRADGATVTCTVDNGGLKYEAATTSNPTSRVHFIGDCARSRDDQGVKLQRLCIF